MGSKQASRQPVPVDQKLLLLAQSMPLRATNIKSNEFSVADFSGQSSLTRSGSLQLEWSQPISKTTGASSMHAEAVACAQDSPGLDSQEMVGTTAQQVSLLSTSSARLKPLLALPSMPAEGQAPAAALSLPVEQAPLQGGSVKETDEIIKQKKTPLPSKKEKAVQEAGLDEAVSATGKGPKKSEKTQKKKLAKGEVLESKQENQVEKTGLPAKGTDKLLDQKAKQPSGAEKVLEDLRKKLEEKKKDEKAKTNASPKAKAKCKAKAKSSKKRKRKKRVSPQF